jgi:glycyl-tRNA synthetase alpha subunit
MARWAEITQFTYFHRPAGTTDPVSVEITYGLNES